MTTYKQTVLDIKDYISFEVARIDRLLDGVTLVYNQTVTLKAEKEALEDISDIIKENGQ
jgi:hypothetical protein